MQKMFLCLYFLAQDQKVQIKVSYVHLFIFYFGVTLVTNLVIQ